MPLELLRFDDTRVLIGHAASWNDLWRRSDTDSPSARAETTLAWIEQFAPDQPFQALVVTDGSRWLAALPLVGQRVKHLLRVGNLPHNPWSSGGDLLVDPQADVTAVLDVLCGGVASLSWPLLWLDNVACDAPRWTAFRAALDRAGMSHDLARQGRVAQVEIGDDWEAYEATRNGDHRRSRRRYARKLQEAGEVRFESVAPSGDRPCDDERIDQLVWEGFAIEDRSWKGTEGTSAIRGGMLGFYQRQARALAAAGNLELVFLKLGDRPIAFAYGWRSKGVAFVAKLGYDDEFRQFGPGQQLIMRWLERLHADPTCRLLDFWGPLVPWNESWATRTYDVGRLVVAPRRAFSRGLLYAYETLRQRKAKRDMTEASANDA